MNQSDIEKAILIQTVQLKQVDNRFHELNAYADKVESVERGNRTSLDELDKKMEKMFSSLGIDRKSCDLGSTQGLVTITKEELRSIEYGLPNLEPIQTPTFNSWEDYRQQIPKYMQKNQLNVDEDPLTQMLSSGQIENLDRRYKGKFGDIKWSRWDYGVVGIAALAGILLDIFIVSIPKTEIWRGKEYNGSSVTKYFQESAQKIQSGNSDNEFLNWCGRKQKELEAYAKVPYDISRNNKSTGINVAGLGPHHHRLMSPGHDPILGFISGIIDIMRGTCTLIDRHGVIQTIPNNTGMTTNPLEALVRVAAHLLSDIPTSAGVQPPFFTLLQVIKAKSGVVLGPSGEQVSYSDLARYMYKHGYTLGHFATMSVVPLVIEIIIRTYHKLARFHDVYGSEEETLVSKDLKLCTLLTMGHSLASCGNVFKMYLNGWNPTSFNWAEMLTLVKSFYSLYMAQKEREQAIENHLFNNWQQLYKNSSIGIM